MTTDVTSGKTVPVFPCTCSTPIHNILVLIYIDIYKMQTHRALTRTQNGTNSPILLCFLAEQDGGPLVGIYVQCIDMCDIYSMDPSSNSQCA